MLLGVRFSSFFGVMPRVAGVSARSMRVMRRLFVMTAFVVLSGLLVMVRGMRVVLGGLLVMLGCFL